MTAELPVLIHRHATAGAVALYLATGSKTGHDAAILFAIAPFQDFPDTDCREGVTSVGRSHHLEGLVPQAVVLDAVILIGLLSPLLQIDFLGDILRTG